MKKAIYLAAAFILLWLLAAASEVAYCQAIEEIYRAQIRWKPGRYPHRLNLHIRSLL